MIARQLKGWSLLVQPLCKVNKGFGGVSPIYSLAVNSAWPY